MKFIEKPWGSELIIESNDKYTFKKLTMNKGCQCSLQYHEYKHETIYVISGVLVIKHGISLDTISTKTYNTGCTISIKPGEIHRMEALEDSVYLEASTPELDDVIRLQDDYIRSNL